MRFSSASSRSRATTGSTFPAVVARWRRAEQTNLQQIRAQQEADAVDLLKRRREWASDAGVLLYRCEVDSGGRLAFVNLDADSKLGSEKLFRGAMS